MVRRRRECLMSQWPGELCTMDEVLGLPARLQVRDECQTFEVLNQTFLRENMVVEYTYPYCAHSVHEKSDVKQRDIVKWRRRLQRALQRYCLSMTRRNRQRFNVPYHCDLRLRMMFLCSEARLIFIANPEHRTYSYTVSTLTDTVSGEAFATRSLFFLLVLVTSLLQPQDALAIILQSCATLVTTRSLIPERTTLHSSVTRRPDILPLAINSTTPVCSSMPASVYLQRKSMSARIASRKHTSCIFATLHAHSSTSASTAHGWKEFEFGSTGIRKRSPLCYLSTFNSSM